MTKKEAMDFVSTDGSELKNLPVNFRDDKEIVLAAISNYGSSLEYASSEIKADKKKVTTTRTMPIINTDRTKRTR